MTIIAPRAAAIGQDFTGSDMIETTGYAKPGDGGGWRYYLIEPASYLGASANAGPEMIEALGK